MPTSDFSKLERAVRVPNLFAGVGALLMGALGAAGNRGEHKAPKHGVSRDLHGSPDNEGILQRSLIVYVERAHLSIP